MLDYDIKRLKYVRIWTINIAIMFVGFSVFMSFREEQFAPDWL